MLRRLAARFHIAVTSTERALVFVVSVLLLLGVIAGASLIGGSQGPSKTALFIGAPAMIVGITLVALFFAFGWYGWTPKQTLAQVRKNFKE